MSKEPKASETAKAEDQHTEVIEKISTENVAAASEDRDVRASGMVRRFAIWAGGAALVPVPLIDVAAVGGLQLQMLRKLSEVYEVPFSENIGKSILASFAGAAIPASSGVGIASALKFVPGVGTLAGALSMPALSAAATYAIGKAFIEHFRSGGTFLDFEPPDYHEFIKNQKELFSRRASAASADEAQASSETLSGAAGGN